MVTFVFSKNGLPPALVVIFLPFNFGIPHTHCSQCFCKFDTGFFIKYAYITAFFFNLTPTPAPFSGMNSTPASSKVLRTASTFFADARSVP